MNHKNTTTAIVAVLVGLILTATAFTVTTRQAFAWGFFGNGIKVDQSINQLNKCTNPQPDDTYKQSSYDMNTDNQPSTDSSHANTNNQTSTESSHTNTNNQPSTK